MFVLFGKSFKISTIQVRMRNSDANKAYDMMSALSLINQSSRSWVSIQGSCNSTTCKVWSATSGRKKHSEEMETVTPPASPGPKLPLLGS
jgi:hypothetical protein